MCGISGYANIKGHDVRMALVYALGEGIDRRGGHAAGYVSMATTTRIGRKLGDWSDASEGFLREASSGELCMMHARYATCGKRTIDEAHPFTIKRQGRTILHGAHNGMIYNAEEASKAYNRRIRVDSEEIFHRIADGKPLDELEGYGVAMWVETSDERNVKIVRLSKDSDLHVFKTKCGGTIWGSTAHIVLDAADFAGIEIEYAYDVGDVGRVYLINRDGVFQTEKRDMAVSSFEWFTSKSQKRRSKELSDEWTLAMREYYQDLQSWKDDVGEDDYSQLFADM